ncbi:MAG: cupin domain-containing protein [Planctomycetota bacterium]
MDKEDLQSWIDQMTEQHGFRLDAIFPADAPRTAEMSADGVRLRLEIDAPAIETAHGDWVAGRAGMEYRDLLPSRLGGAVIASHIRIRDGGLVPDYVHYHEVGFQIIYCKSGWVKVVYEDQGEPFVLQAGDCVLQPPKIRHRVLECSDGLEVFEVGCPAEHRTLVEHELELPNAATNPGRLFANQRFVRHQVAQAIWEPWSVEGFESRDLGIADATQGLADARVVRPMNSSRVTLLPHQAIKHALSFDLENGAWLVVQIPMP